MPLLKSNPAIIVPEVADLVSQSLLKEESHEIRPCVFYSEISSTYSREPCYCETLTLNFLRIDEKYQQQKFENPVTLSLCALGRTWGQW
jgi:hypothetical protein